MTYILETKRNGHWEAIVKSESLKSIEQDAELLRKAGHEVRIVPKDAAARSR